MIGQRISHYRIESEIGRGGMGVVYRALDERLGRAVALKVLAENRVGPEESRARVLAEARAAAALNHPGIITVYEVGEEGPLLFLVMELVAGTTLRTRLEKGPCEPSEGARLVVQIAEALEAAHESGRAHGDIKPENVIVGPDGRVKLLDFGIARTIVERTVSRTMTASAPAPASSDPHLSGTLAYLAPEILRGDPADYRADLFSLGVVLYELMAGRRPFPGPDAPLVMMQILQSHPPQLGPGVPAELARIVFRLLEKQPSSRYQTARELRLDLMAILATLDMGAAQAAVASGKRSVAVLPFRLLTPNPEDDYLSVALADALIHELASNEKLLVRPTSAVERYAKRSADPLLAARELNVDVLVDGSIQKSGQRLRVHVQARGMAEAATLCSSKHDGEMSDLFSLQDEIAASLIRALGVGTARQSTEPEGPPTKHPLAYELYLRAAERLSRLNRWDTRTAIEMLDNAVKLDPRFGAAWARLAEACVLMAVTLEPGPRWLARANGAVRRALTLDPQSDAAHCARGRLLWTPGRGFRTLPALRALRTALEINPGCHPALIWRSMILMHAGIYPEAMEGLRTALAMRPDDAFTLVFTGQTAMYQLKFDEANEYQARALRADPGNLWANVFYPSIEIYHGNLNEAAERIRQAQQVLPNDSWLVSCEALLWAKRGERRRATQAITRALRGNKPLLHTHHMWHTLACTHAVLGQPDRALTWLRKAGMNGLPNYRTFQIDPHLVPLRERPDFVKLVHRLKREVDGYEREFGN
jgi:serine/threonine protein kinase/Tfp pilus assembly protein PilF